MCDKGFLKMFNELLKHNGKFCIRNLIQRYYEKRTLCVDFGGPCGQQQQCFQATDSSDEISYFTLGLTFSGGGSIIGCGEDIVLRHLKHDEKAALNLVNLSIT